MSQETYHKILIYLIPAVWIAFAFLPSCNQEKVKSPSSKKSEKDTVIVKGNMTTTVSSDINELEGLLDFKYYRPIKGMYKYVFIDNGGSNERITVPGPSDYYLYCLLYFDSLTFNKMLAQDAIKDYQPPHFSKEEFKFDFLNKEILNELENSKENYHGHPGLFFGKEKAKLWLLDKKVLLKLSTN